MKKSTFDIQAFFKKFANEKIISDLWKEPPFRNPKYDNLFLNALSNGFGEDVENSSDAIDYIDFDLQDFINPKKTFQSISKNFSYIPLVRVRDSGFDGEYIRQEEYGYLFTNKSEFSFLIVSTFYNGAAEWNPMPVRLFKKFDVKKIVEVSKLALSRLNKLHDKDSNCNVYLNKNIKWDDKLLDKIFKKSDIIKNYRF